MNSNRWLDYSLEAMEPSEVAQMKYCEEAFNELKDKLNSSYVEQQISADFFLIGSILTDTRISEFDPIDMLIVYYGNENLHSSNEKAIPIEELIVLREITKKTLKTLFPEALLDDSQPLALTLSNPSQSCSFCLYFSSRQRFGAVASGINSSSNELTLLNKQTSEFELINPIKAIQEINLRDVKVKGNEKNLIRILKNLKADSSKPIKLSGYFIAGLVHSMEEYTLEKPPGQLLFLLLECSLYFKRLNENSFLRRVIRTPDGLSQIFQEDEAFLLKELEKLKNELDLLIKYLVLEIDLYTNVREPVTIST